MNLFPCFFQKYFFFPIEYEYNIENSTRILTSFAHAYENRFSILCTYTTTLYIGF